ncbi:MAG: hypothetical protein AAF827_02285 [Cyanobacteria bacterium P01_D01_bin.6]
MPSHKAALKQGGFAVSTMSWRSGVRDGLLPKLLSGKHHPARTYLTGNETLS